MNSNKTNSHAQDPSFSNAAEDLFAFLDDSPTAYQAAANIRERLEDVGFKPFDQLGDHKLSEGDRFYLSPNGSAIYAVAIGHSWQDSVPKILGAHLDSPCLKIKQNPLIRQEDCLLLACEVYGGPILNTWFDRPLSIAGRVALKSEKTFSPKLCTIDLRRPLLTLPNLAIHMNRDVNDGVKIQAQKVLLPVLSSLSATEDESAKAGETSKSTNPFMALLCEACHCEASDILDYDLYVYPCEPAACLGLDASLFASARLDNLWSAHAGLRTFEALAKTDGFEGICILAFSDNEEIGSRSKQGAGSSVLRDLWDLLCSVLIDDPVKALRLRSRAYLLSADLAHAVHPHHGELSDANNRPRVNGGPVLKTAANLSYCSDAEAGAIFRTLCELADIPCQIFVNRSDLRGGSTIGPISSQLMPIRCADFGMPIWGMHSLRETAGVRDIERQERLFRQFFTTAI